MFNPSAIVYRKKIINGISIPAIIHNGNYFFADLDVYEDGRVNCWNFEDLESFKRDVQRGWVVLNIPDNEEISIHGLGDFAIENGSWHFNKETFIDYVQDLIRSLNPGLKNIFEYSEKKVNGVRIGEDGTGWVYREHKRTAQDPFPEKINGQRINLFYKEDKVYHLVNVSIFTDGSLQLSRLEENRDVTMETVEKMVTAGSLLTDIPVGSTVQIHGLGSFSIKESTCWATIQDKLLEIRDIHKALTGEPTTIEICQQAHSDYLANPTKANKEKLRVAYESVPDHQKMYVGDMDTKDIAVRMIIYGEQEIEKWSHYIVAKKMGVPLPSIKVPKPKDE